jgi:hydrogenase expression/formation protein HypE
MSGRVGEKYGVLGERITLKHGAGGRAMRMLIEERLAVGFPEAGGDHIGLAAMDDGAAFRIGDRWLVVTTDSHVINPVFFPGGDIGRLAVAGTVNDLAMMGATEALGLTSAVVIEEGYLQADLERIQLSMQETCREAGATIVTGDTKVMGTGELDGIIINTTGVALADTVVPDSGLRPGDRILITGPIGDHGIALMAARRGLGLEGDLRSDVAPINGLIREALSAADGAIGAMKDPTRGGLASALTEMAEKSRVGIVIEEQAVPVTDVVRSAAEVLGLDAFEGGARSAT